MKEIPTESFTLTEIGGVGEMIYKAVRFPEYVPVYNHESKEDEIVPLFSCAWQPTGGTDYGITGQGLLASLCNFYKKLNDPNNTESITDSVWNWCRGNIHPYDIDKLCDEIEHGDFMDGYFHERLCDEATFNVRDFVSDLCRLGTAFEYYDTLRKVRWDKDVSAGRSLYYEGRLCDSIAFLEKYSQYMDDEEYLEHFNENYNERVYDALELFPDFKMRVKQDPKTHKAEMVADIHSVFDIAWYAFARMVSDVAPPPDSEMDYEFSQGSILTCMCCGEYFVRHSSRQRYCDNPNCQAERNKRKARAYYERKKAEEKE